MHNSECSDKDNRATDTIETYKFICCGCLKTSTLLVFIKNHKWMHIECGHCAHCYRYVWSTKQLWSEETRKIVDEGSIFLLEPWE